MIAFVAIHIYLSQDFDYCSVEVHKVFQTDYLKDLKM